MWYRFILCLALQSAVVRCKSVSYSEGEVCLFRSLERWRCVAESLCTDSGSLDTCNSAGGSKVVCCPQNKISRTQQTTQAPQQRIAAKKCQEYSKHIWVESFSLMATEEKIRKCTFKSTPLIIGGRNAEIMEYPHMAQLGYVVKINSMERIQWGGCGGSLISEKYVLTAAHCIRPKRAPSDVKWASFGEVKVRGVSQSRQLKKVIEWHTPDGYNADLRSNDIGLLKLESNVQMSPYVRPACLDLRGTPAETYEATGWGKTGNNLNERKSNILQQVSLPHVPVEICNESYVGILGLTSGIEKNLMLCAGGQIGKDTCQGDSGGPLQVKLADPDCMYSIVGITSFSVEGCGTATPGVYTRVYGYLDWIERIVWPMVLCL